MRKLQGLGLCWLSNLLGVDYHESTVLIIVIMNELLKMSSKTCVSGKGRWIYEFQATVIRKIQNCKAARIHLPDAGGEGSISSGHHRIGVLGGAA